MPFRTARCPKAGWREQTLASGIHPDMQDAADRKVRHSRRTYHSNQEFEVIYDHLCAEYQRPHDHFGRDARSTMKGLTRIKHGA